MGSDKIREIFFRFFVGENHDLIDSAPVFLRGDKNVEFVNSGISALKRFMGSRTPRKIINSQRCVRISGKHNDFHEVGFDDYHHTMFEMLGNWSFNGYDKKKTICWVLRLLNGRYGIKKQRIYVTIFLGDKTDKVRADINSYYVWRKRVRKNHLFFFNKKHNFWRINDEKLCGYSSEVHVPSGGQRADFARLINERNQNSIIELWNIVFVRFYGDTGRLFRLRRAHVDTGMGLERLCKIIQNKNSNYETDLFWFIIQAIERKSHVKYGNDNNAKNVAFRIISDHVRSVVFMISDMRSGGHVNKINNIINHMMKKVVRNYYLYLRVGEIFVHDITVPFVLKMRKWCADLELHQDHIRDKIKTIERYHLVDLVGKIRNPSLVINDRWFMANHLKVISGVYVFHAYETYGWDLDLIKYVLRKSNYEIREREFFRTKNTKARGDRGRTRFVMGNVCTGALGVLNIYVLRYTRRNQKKQKYQITLNYASSVISDSGRVRDVILRNNYETVRLTIRGQSIYADVIPKYVFYCFRASAVNPPADAGTQHEENTY